MTELDDFDLEQQQTDSSFQPQYETQPPSGRGRWLIVGGVLLLLVLAAVYVFFWRQPGEPPALAAVADLPSRDARLPASSPADQPAAEEPLPTLDQSDSAVAAIISRLSSHPTLLTWVATPNLIRTFAVAVENMATGTNPSRHLRFLAPEGTFQVRDTEGGYRLNTGAGTSANPYPQVLFGTAPLGRALALR